jgi:hypothetical protein
MYSVIQEKIHSPNLVYHIDSISEIHRVSCILIKDFIHKSFSCIYSGLLIRRVRHIFNKMVSMDKGSAGKSYL